MPNESSAILFLKHARLWSNFFEIEFGLWHTPEVSPKVSCVQQVFGLLGIILNRVIHWKIHFWTHYYHMELQWRRQVPCGMIWKSVFFLFLFPGSRGLNSFLPPCPSTMLFMPYNRLNQPKLWNKLNSDSSSCWCWAFCSSDRKADKYRKLISLNWDRCVILW